MGLLLDILVDLFRFVGVEVDWGRRRKDVRGVRAARTPAEARELLTQIARRLELEADVGTRQVRMLGRASDMPLEVDVRYAMSDEQVRFQIEVRIESPRPLPGPFSVMPPELAPSGAWSLGESRWDRMFRINGDEARLVQTLTPSVREYILGLAGALEVEPDGLRFAATRAATFLPSLVESLASLVRLLGATPPLTPERLASRVELEPLTAVRRRGLAALIRTFPEEPATKAACRGALEDPSAKLRLEAAAHLGEEGWGGLRRLVVDPAVEPGLRMAAARRLPETDGASIEALLAQLEGRDDGALTAARLLGRLGPAAAIRPLTSLSRDSRRDRRTREAAQQAVARIQDRHPEAQHGHLSLLGEDEGSLSLPDHAGALADAGRDVD